MNFRRNVMKTEAKSKVAPLHSITQDKSNAVAQFEITNRNSTNITSQTPMDYTKV